MKYEIITTTDDADLFPKSYQIKSTYCITKELYDAFEWLRINMKEDIIIDLVQLLKISDVMHLKRQSWLKWLEEEHGGPIPQYFADYNKAIKRIRKGKKYDKLV